MSSRYREAELGRRADHVDDAEIPGQAPASSKCTMFRTAIDPGWLKANMLNRPSSSK